MREGGFLESEKSQSPDFLRSDIRLRVVVTPEAQDHLPEISSEDLESGKERYRLFLGSWEKKQGEVNLNIEGIYEVPDEPWAYEEGEYEVTINLPAIIQQFEQLKNQHPEYAHLQILGDIHTHPVFKDQMPDGVNPWDPSSGDIADMIKNYEEATISGEKPFVFAIAVPHPDGRTLYAYYHMNQDDGRWSYKSIE